MTGQYRRRVQQATENISKLQNDKSNLVKKSGDFQKKANSASSAASKARTPSAKQSKLREAERANSELASIEGKIARKEKDIAGEYKKLNDSQVSLSREEDREARKRRNEVANKERRTKQQMTSFNHMLRKHDSLHRVAMEEIESLKNLPENITVLFLASNPLDQAKLRLDEEVRAIQEFIRKSEHRDSVKLESRWAVRPLDALQAINECEPTIVHFSGHGSDYDEIVFQDDFGNTRLVTKEAMEQLIAACSASIQLVFFNTCYSNSQAELAVKHVPAAIGMNTSIGDDAARIFASQFYSAIGFGKSLKVAFDQAKAALMVENIPQEDIPELFMANGLESEEFHIIRPPE